MGKPKYYISCPISIDEAILKKYQSVLWHLGAEPISWSRSTVYNHQDDIDECDGFVLILPSNNFKLRVDELPIGCKRELIRAVNASKKLYLAYDNKEGATFYRASVSNFNSNDAFFSGIASTRKEVMALIRGQATHMAFIENTEATQAFSGAGLTASGALSGLTDTIGNDITTIQSSSNGFGYTTAPSYNTAPLYNPNDLCANGMYTRRPVNVYKSSEDLLEAAIALREAIEKFNDRRLLLLV